MQRVRRVIEIACAATGVIMYDLIIRGGAVADGTGAQSRSADVGIVDGLIVEVGKISGPAQREFNADGRIVAPGWVGIHAHYDGQATWDSELAPSSWHGVTTAIMGNCGVGFAPVRPSDHERLIQLMEGVEDIPGSALAIGLSWDWESFPEYLDRLCSVSRTIDIGAQVPHGPVRAYVMGERGARNQPATADDIQAMAQIVTEGLRAGALGFSTSRTLLHKARGGEPVPGTFAGREELLGIGRGMAAAGHGVLELSSDMAPAEEEFGWISELSATLGIPVTYALVQTLAEPTAWRRLLELTSAAERRGARISPQFACRPTGMLLGWESRLHPFIASRNYRKIAHLPMGERITALQQPETRARILADPVFDIGEMGNLITQGFDRMFCLGNEGDLDYEPTTDKSVASRARREGHAPAELVYDMMMKDEGRGYVYIPFLNYADFNLDHVAEIMAFPGAVPGLADGGAHCGFICDASFPTYMLTHWVRDRTRGRRISLERAIALQTRETAKLYGLRDRGLVAPGMKADLNVIDLQRLNLAAPETRHDLPGGAPRLVQQVEGYAATFVRGVMTFADGEPTGAQPGRLIRGPQTPSAQAA
jgi:N-acyl-D-amino-acid deacylase